MTRTAVLLVIAAAVVVQPAASKQRAPVRLNGTATLRAIQFADCVRVDAVDAKVVECDGSGAYGGTPVRAAATYTWHWHLFHGGDVPQTAHGDEDGLLVLGFGKRGVLRLTTAGAKSSGATAGTWRFRSGTKQFAGRRGTGTYRFLTTGGANGFSSARVVVRGTLR